MTQSVRPVRSCCGGYARQVPGWQELRLDLLRIREESPRALQGYPDPACLTRDERVEVDLAAWVEELAAELHAKYGTYLSIRLGAFRYPPIDGEIDRVPELPTLSAAQLNLAVTAAEPLSVASGHDKRCDVVVANHGTVVCELHTIGHVRAYVVDDRRRVVGGFVGAVNLPLVRFRVEADSTGHVPALVGTASLRPQIGYTVPPGSWELVVELPTTQGTAVSETIPIDIT